MFLGHFAVGLAAKRLTPYTSLGSLVVAVQFLDLLWPVFLLLGIERVRIDPGNTLLTPLAFEHYPWTHSLAMALLWGAAFGGLYLLFRRYPRGAWVLALGVCSHWVLDVVVHRPDLPLVPGLHTRLGLGLWNNPTGTIALEVSLFAAGVWLYARSTEPVDAVGTYSLSAFTAALLAIYGAALFGPVPPGSDAVAYAGLAQWLLVAWALWVDRHRVAVRQWQ
jgi:membrane-bound metal-dependent hydrolase YbcI (DUF457 family)